MKKWSLFPKAEKKRFCPEIGGSRDYWVRYSRNVILGVTVLISGCSWFVQPDPAPRKVSQSDQQVVIDSLTESAAMIARQLTRLAAMDYARKPVRVKGMEARKWTATRLYRADDRCHSAATCLPLLLFSVDEGPGLRLMWSNAPSS